jgi:ketosteroid isomerase-like protein
MRALSLLFVLVATTVVILLVAKLPPPSPEMSEAEIAQIEAEVREVVEARFEALRNLDMDKVLRSAHPDLLVWAAEGRIMNAAAYRDGMHAWAEGKESWRGRWVETKVRVLTPDLAVFSGSYVDTIQYSDGRHLHCPKCSAVFLFERTTNGWKYTMGAGSAVPAEPVQGG